MDKHNTRKISNITATVVSALFAAFGIAGYRRTEDLTQLFIFLGLSLLAYGVVKVLFVGVNKLLDTLDDK